MIGLFAIWLLALLSTFKTTEAEEPPEGEVDDNPDDDDDLSDPDKKLLSEEAKRYRLRAKSEKERADAAQKAIADAQKERDDLKDALEKANPETAEQLTRERDFYKDFGHRFGDGEAALKLLDPKLVEARGLAQAVEHVLRRYPFLAKDDEKGKAPLPTSPSGSPMHGKKGPKQGLDKEELKRRFPSLARRMP